jgi:hypothetical protein
MKMRKLFAVIVAVVLIASSVAWAGQGDEPQGILDLPFPWNILGAAAAILLIGTFLFRMIKGRWWWKKEEPRPSPDEGTKGSEQKTP